MKYIYGPVKSRRLGPSLGLSLTPHKICDFDCIYCQLGRTKEPAAERKEYIKTTEVINELKSWLQNNQEEAKSLSYITISGAGEPTLNTEIGSLISEIKKLTDSPVAVITNASLLSRPEVREALLGADLIVPTLNTVIPSIFEKIARPHQNIKIEEIIQGLINLRKEFHGKIWIEVMIIEGLNDDLPGVRKLKDIIDKINPDKVQINSPVRTTADKHVSCVPMKKLEKIREILGDKCQIV
ncbi:MAG: radical SAM protein [Candidatus Omnitrophota bacterium]